VDKNNLKKQPIKDLLGAKSKKKIVIKKTTAGAKKNILEKIQKAQEELNQKKAKKLKESKAKIESAKAEGKTTKKARAEKAPAKKKATRKKRTVKSTSLESKISAETIKNQKAKTMQVEDNPVEESSQPRVSFEIPPKKVPRSKTAPGKTSYAGKRPGETKRKRTSERAASRKESAAMSDLESLSSTEINDNLISAGFKIPAKKGFFGLPGRGKKGARKRREFAKGAAGKDPERDSLSSVSIPKEIEILDNISVGEMAKKLNVKASVLIGKLMKMGMMGTINSIIDSDTATLLAEEFNCKVHRISLYEETIIKEEKGKASDLKPRAPIITVMGHVDHGKTKLLDCIRKQNVVATESGGITQHIGAYKVKTSVGEIVFLDTPGHEAFTAMRARGSSITDIVILVVAADDGVMPQTIEAINHAKAAQVPIIVAINKIDKANAKVEKVKESLSSHNLLLEDWGGDVQSVEISAKENINIDKLLEAITLQSELLDLKANPKIRAVGTVVEATMDPGRGPVSTILVQNGSLKQGGAIVVGRYAGKARAIFDDMGNRLKKCGPSTPVEILGIEGIPGAGDPFHVVPTEKEAKIISSKRIELDKLQHSKTLKRLSLDDLNEIVAEGELKDLNIIIKGDVQGSVEAIHESLVKLSNENVRIKIIHAQTGGITESDIMLASASDAIILGFHVRPNAKSVTLAEKEGIQIKYYSVIYDLIDDVKNALTGMLEPKFEEVTTGSAEIRKLFKISKVGTIAGCMMMSGKMKKSNLARVIRDNVVVYEGKIKTLRREKNDVNEVSESFECGIYLEDFNDIKVDDVIEAYEMKEVTTKI
jgi:translation initiation factor IF-2